MARFHIGKTGKSAACNARIGNCPLGGDDEHFKTREEANKAAEKKMSDSFNPTASSQKKDNTVTADKERKSSVSKKNLGFKIPEGEVGEGYMGSPSWVGGNLKRLQEEKAAKGDGSYISNKEIASELRNDIKNAVKSGYLPSELNGAKVKYSVATKDNSINLTAKVDTSVIDLSSVDTQNSQYAWDRGDYLTLRDGNIDTAEISNKLEKMGNSYKSDFSNSQVDYFDTNFYNRVKVEGKGSFSDVDKASNKLNKALVDAVKTGKVDIAQHPGPKYNGGDKIVTEAIQKDPKVRQALIEYKEAEEHYQAHNKLNHTVYNTNVDLRQDRAREGDHPYDSIIDMRRFLDQRKSEISQETQEKVHNIKANTNENTRIEDIIDKDSSEANRIFKKFHDSLARAGYVKKERRINYSRFR